MAFLRKVYGPGVEKLKVSNREFKFGSTKVDLTLLSSNYHIELNASDAGGNNDKGVIQEILSGLSETRSLVSASSSSSGGLASMRLSSSSSSSSSTTTTTSSSSSSSSTSSTPGFKVVILNEVDKLSRQAQNALRRTMEKATAACRLILCANSTTKIIEPLRSRCLTIRVGAPSVAEAKGILESIAAAEGLALPDKLATRIVRQSERNLRRSILALEACKVQAYPFHEEQTVAAPDWELFVGEIAKSILEEQSPKRLKAVRSQFYDLLTHCIPPALILNKLVDTLVDKLDTQISYGVVFDAAIYEHRLQLGAKPIFHLEAFVAQFMFRYKQYLINAFG